jgi:hypothetical protein
MPLNKLASAGLVPYPAGLSLDCLRPGCLHWRPACRLVTQLCTDLGRAHSAAHCRGRGGNNGSHAHTCISPAKHLGLKNTYTHAQQKKAKMLTRRLLVLAPAAVATSGLVYGGCRRPAYAHVASPTDGGPLVTANSSSYRDRFAELNKIDQELLNDQRRADVSEEFGYPAVVAQLDNQIVHELDFTRALYSKPLTPQMRIRLRNLILPYLERSEGETKEFFEAVLRHYDML